MKKISLLFTLLFSVLMLASCGDKSNSSTNDNTKPSETITETEDEKAIKLYNNIIEQRYTSFDVVIISTLVKSLAPIALDAVKNNKHVLVEKPAGKNFAELEQIINIANEKNLIVKAGFNHWYHPAILKAKEIITNNHDKTGDIMFIRGRYGHGGRVGYDKEWRANPELSGGGELIDQGVHLIDLSRFFMGDFDEIQGFSDTYYWNMPVDDNAFITLRKNDGRAAWLQVSCTEWKNMFSFEIYCKNAKFIIDGLGGSYGTEKLSYYQMLPEMGPPETVIYEFPRGDNSWRKEWVDFVSAVKNKTRNIKFTGGDILDAYKALKFVDEIYKQDEQRKIKKERE